jgi:putative endonuclease
VRDEPSIRGAGRWAEDQALDYLKRAGLRLLCRNFRSRFGEIDLVMAERALIVFVEVRLRSSGRFGSGFETVTRVKQRRLIATARVYLARHGSNAVCRFDVVSVTQRNYVPAFLWLKDAFDQDG